MAAPLPKSKNCMPGPQALTHLRAGLGQVPAQPAEADEHNVAGLDRGALGGAGAGEDVMLDFELRVGASGGLMAVDGGSRENAMPSRSAPQVRVGGKRWFASGDREQPEGLRRFPIAPRG